MIHKLAHLGMHHAAHYLAHENLVAGAGSIAGTFSDPTGYGSCQLCDCQAYMGNENVCQNCYHGYDYHY